jgi:hypothetical protein
VECKWNFVWWRDQPPLDDGTPFKTTVHEFTEQKGCATHSSAPVLEGEYFPITKQELSLIKNNCFHPETDSCDGCEYTCDDEKSVPCSWIGANGLEDKILERQPYNEQSIRQDATEKVLGRIELWCEGYFNTGYEGSVGELNDIKRYIKQLRRESKQEQP